MRPHHKKRFRRRVKVCRFTVEKINYIDYKDIELLREYTPTNGKILPRRVTGTRPGFPAQADEGDQAGAFHGAAALFGSLSLADQGPGALSPVFSPGFIARAAKGSQMLGFSRIERRRRSRATLRSAMSEKHDRWLPFAARSRHPVRRPG